VIDSVI